MSGLHLLKELQVNFYISSLSYVVADMDYIQVLFFVHPNIYIHSLVDASMDYTTLSPIVLTFGECDVRRCVNVSIDDDLVIEAEESFAVTLEEMEERITISREDGNITIIDDDSMFVIALFCVGHCKISFTTFQMPLLDLKRHSTRLTR